MPAPCAREHALALFDVERTRSCSFGPMASQHLELLGCQFGLPFGVGLVHGCHGLNTPCWNAISPSNEASRWLITADISPFVHLSICPFVHLSICPLQVAILPRVSVRTSLVIAFTALNLTIGG